MTEYIEAGWATQLWGVRGEFIFLVPGLTSYSIFIEHLMVLGGMDSWASCSTFQRVQRQGSLGTAWEHQLARSHHTKDRLGPPTPPPLLSPSLPLLGKLQNITVA